MQRPYNIFPMHSEREDGGVSILVVGSVALDTVETPFTKVNETLGGAASYFTTAASLYNQVNLVAIVGSDFPPEHLNFWRNRPVNLDGLQIKEGRTFRWTARYHMDMNARDTLDTQLGVYADFHPIIPEKYHSSELLFLANIQPELPEVIKRVDVLLMSEEEIRQYTNRPSIVAGVRQLLDMGLQYVVVKQGSYGALLFGADGTFFSAPTYPLEEVIDPTGAGDAFAGGFLGYLSQVAPQQDGHYAIDEIKRGVVHGNIIGSYVCEDFSIDRLRTLTIVDVARRYQSLVEYSHFDPSWCFR